LWDGIRYTEVRNPLRYLRNLFHDILNDYGRVFVVVRYSENTVIGMRGFTEEEKKQGLTLVFSRKNFKDLAWAEDGSLQATLGFGTGNSILNLAESVGPSGHVCGIDISPGMLAVAKKKIAERGMSARVELAVGDARELPFDDESFDAAFASFTLELFELEDIPKVLAQVRRILKSRGRVGIVSMATVKENEAPSTLERTYIWMHRHFPHIVDCQPIDVVQVVRDAGFEIQKEIDMKIWTMPVRAVVGTVR